MSNHERPHPPLSPPSRLPPRPCSSLMKDMNSSNDLYRSNAIRVLCRIIDSQMLLQIERYLKQVGVGRSCLATAQYGAAGGCTPAQAAIRGQPPCCACLLCRPNATLPAWPVRSCRLCCRLWWTRARWWRARCWRGPSTWRGPMPRSSSAGATRCRRRSTAGTPWCSSRWAASIGALLTAAAAPGVLFRAAVQD